MFFFVFLLKSSTALQQHSHPQGRKFKATESRKGQGKEKDRGKGKCLERIYVSFLFDLKWELNSTLFWL